MAVMTELCGHRTFLHSGSAVQPQHCLCLADKKTALRKAARERLSREHEGPRATARSTAVGLAEQAGSAGHGGHPVQAEQTQWVWGHLSVCL